MAKRASFVPKKKPVAAKRAGTRRSGAPVLSALVLAAAVCYALWATRELDVLKFVALGQFDWDASTTSVPISSASVALKALLARDIDAIPTALSQAVPPADTIRVQDVRDWLNARRLARLETVCAGARRCAPAKRGAYGTTALHVAAFSGDEGLGKYLQERGAMPAFDDAHRRPGNLSFAAFISNARKAAREAGRECELPVVDYAKAGAVEETRRLVEEGEPVLLKGALSYVAKEMVEQFSVDALLNKYGEAVVRVGAVPYAKAFNLSTNEMTLRQFHERHVKRATADEVPLYVFAKEEKVCGKGYEAMVKLIRQAFPALISDPEETGGAGGMHFYLGRKGSGAPFHLHADAANAAVSGSKRWFVYTPQRSIYSRIPVLNWVNHVLPTLSEEERPLTCTQQAGDIIYVPLDWGHAVLNEDDNTFGFALELLNRRDTLLDVAGRGSAILG